MIESVSIREASPWPHRLAVALALVTFPLIWVGGLVTTYDAGMAVPDWPGTYGYNLLAYPWTTWIAGPWDLFIEHGHRLLGATAGLVAIALVVVTFRTDRRAWLRFAVVGALALVIVQGALGGARVLLDERLVALIHGCVGPLFFAYLAGLVVATSRWWNVIERQPTTAGGPTNPKRKRGSIGKEAVSRSRFGFVLEPLVQSAWILAGAAYLQLVLGAVLRHLPLSAPPQAFRIALLFHLMVAGALVVQVGWTAIQAWRTSGSSDRIRVPSLVALSLVVLQIALGIGTYVAKYSWPPWLGEYQFAASFIVQEKSLSQSLITTAHVANGSLILFTSVLLAMRASRIFFVVGTLRVPSPLNGTRNVPTTSFA